MQKLEKAVGFSLECVTIHCSAGRVQAGGEGRRAGT